MRRIFRVLLFVVCLAVLPDQITSLAIATESNTEPKGQSTTYEVITPKKVKELFNFKLRSEMLDQSLTQKYRQDITDMAIELYSTLWNTNELDDILKDSVSRAVNNAKEKESTWNKAKFLWSDDTKQRVLDEIIANTLTNFGPHYDRFLNDFSSNMQKEITTHLQDFQMKLFEGKAKLGLDIPGSRGLLKAGLERAQANFKNEEENRLDNLKKEFETEISGLQVGTGVTAVIYLVLRKKIKDKLLKKAGGVLGRKLVSIAAGPAGWILAIVTLGYDAYDITTTIWNVPEKISENLYLTFKHGYSENAKSEISAICGQAGEEHIKIFVRFAKEYDLVCERLAFDNCPAYINLVKNDTEAGRNQFAFNLYTVSNRTGRDICWLVKELGPEIRGMSTSESLCMIKLLTCASPAITAKWAQLAPNELCYLTESVPLTILCALEPNPTSLETVKKVASLSSKAKNIASKISPEKVVWLVHNLSVHRSTVILTTPDSIQKVEDTISALTEIAPALRDEWAGRLASDYKLVRRVVTEGLSPAEREQNEVLKNWTLEETEGEAFFSISFWLKALKSPIWFTKQLPVLAAILYLVLALIVFRVYRWLFPRKQRDKQPKAVQDIPNKTKKIQIDTKDEKAVLDNKP